MVFSSIPFLFFFLPIVILVYFGLPKSFRNGWLLIGSLVFYIWGSGAFVVLLLISIVVDFTAGKIVERGRTEGRVRLVRAGVSLSVFVNVSLLAFFKYSNWAVDQLNAIGEAVGVGDIAWSSIALPIGISFYTFQSMSYTIDLASGRAKPARNIFDFSLYVAMFPQLIAGPIVRYHEIASEIHQRSERIEDFGAGVVRFTHGLAKKVIVGDSVAIIVRAAFDVAPESLSTLDAWVGLLAYTVQIYFDFSGYSDMAIGLGMMFGFTFPENFRRPYSALSITDFWRRWHITLSNWFRDYVYIPLGGSRLGASRTYVNLWTVFLLTGLWHGANWTFVIWGMYHGTLLISERITGNRVLELSETRRPVLRRGITLLAVMVGWVFFRSPDIGAALGYLVALAPAGQLALDTTAEALTGTAAFALAIGVGSFFLPSDFVVGPWLASTQSRLAETARYASVVLAFPLSVVLLAAGTFSPFLYYQF